MISTAIALAMSLQGATETAIAIKNDNPETWVVEYPRIIRPYVVQYRTCLNVANRLVTGEPDFEIQHRADIPRCTEQEADAKASALEAMRGAKTAISAEEVDLLFRNIGLIHIARGRDLDDQFIQRLRGAERARDTYEENKPKGLVIEMRDASVVKSRAEVAGRTWNEETQNAQD